jgi:hypothetical protein
MEIWNNFELQIYEVYEFYNFYLIKNYMNNDDINILYDKLIELVNNLYNYESTDFEIHNNKIWDLFKDLKQIATLTSVTYDNYFLTSTFYNYIFDMQQLYKKIIFYKKFYVPKLLVNFIRYAIYIYLIIFSLYYGIKKIDKFTLIYDLLSATINVIIVIFYNLIFIIPLNFADDTLSSIGVDSDNIILSDVIERINIKLNSMHSNNKNIQNVDSV